MKVERRIDKNLFLAIMIEVFILTERRNYVSETTIIASEEKMKVERRIDKNLFLAIMIEVFISTERRNYVSYLYLTVKRDGLQIKKTKPCAFARSCCE